MHFIQAKTRNLFCKYKNKIITEDKKISLNKSKLTEGNVTVLRNFRISRHVLRPCGMFSILKN